MFLSNSERSVIIIDIKKHLFSFFHSVILNDNVIGQNSLINKTIIDKNILVGADCSIGDGNDFAENNGRENLLKSGLNLIDKDIIIADKIVIDRNCRIETDINQGDFENNQVKRGSNIK